MTDPTRDPPPDDRTVVYTPAATADSDATSLADDPPAATVGPPPADDLRPLLRRRLLFFALLMTGVFVAGGVLLPLFGARIDGWMAFALTCNGVGGVAAGLLFARRGLSVRSLRLVELALFGTLYAQWTLVHTFLYPTMCLEKPPMWFGVILGYAVGMPWAFLIVAYGVLIPNSWRRSAAVVAVFAVTPLVISKASGLSETATAGHSEGLLLFAVAVVVGAAAALAVYSSHRIEVLRQQADTARRVGPYTLVRRLGAGGMGEVFLARHRLLKRPCAVKLIRPEKAGHAETVRRFEREVQAVTRLTHPGVVQVFDFGRAGDGTFYFVMEYLDGLTLDAVVKRSGPLPAGRVAAVLRQAAAALAEAHDLGLVHRDIKPANLMLCRLGGRCDVLKVLDFGLVAEVDSPDPHLTRDGGILGTPHYLSPEQARGGGVGPTSDLYSLGATAYFLLTGRPPFDEENLFALLTAHQSAEPLAPSVVRADVPAHLEGVVLRLLAKDPAGRFRSAAELTTALAATPAADGWTDADAANWWGQAGG